MVVYSDVKVILFIFIAIAASSYADDPWLSGGRCGPSNKLPDGRPGQCNPNGDHPCCGKSGWCGKTPAHCACTGCISYKNVTPLPTKKPPTTESTTLEPTKLETTTLEAITLEPTTLEATTLEPTTLEATTLEPTTLEPKTEELTTPEPSTEEPTTITPASSTSVETKPGGQIGPRGGRNFPTSTLPEVTITTDATSGGGTAAGHGVDTSPTSNTPHESGDAWIGLVIALCVILLIGVACLINIIRNKRKSGTQNISLTETGVGNASQSKEKKTKVSYSNQGTLPSEERNPQITITTPHMDSQDKAGSDDVDGGKSNAAFSENQDEVTTKSEETKKDQVEGSKESLVEKDNSNDEVNTNFEEETEGKGVTNVTFKEDDVVKSDG